MTLTQKQKDKLKTLPKEPGVYMHKNREGEVIYVGKAAILRNRVRQYFQAPERKDAKTRALVAEIDDTDWIVVDTEMDALFLESEMIKRYMPKWNILLRDDKTVSYVKITMQEKVPFVSLLFCSQNVCCFFSSFSVKENPLVFSWDCPAILTIIRIINIIILSFLCFAR